MSKQPPPAPTASAIGPCSTIIQIEGRPGTGNVPSTIAPPTIFTDGSKDDNIAGSACVTPSDTYKCQLSDNASAEIKAIDLALGQIEQSRNIDFIIFSDSLSVRGWSGGAMVLGKLPVPGRPTIWITVG